MFEEFLQSNKTFWHKEFDEVSTQSCALIDTSLNEPYLLYGILKVGLIFAKIHRLKPLAYPYLSTRRQDMPIIRAMCPWTIAPTKVLAQQFFLRFFSILKTTFHAQKPADLLKITIDHVPVGSYIYDLCYVPRTDNIPLRMRLRIFYALLCFYADASVIENNNVKLVVIGDPVYRGFLFELCKVRNIPCINGINIWTFQMHKYYEQAEFENHCRFVSAAMIQQIPNSPEFNQLLENYFKNRFEGTIQLHDVLRAYSSSKRILSKQQLETEYNLTPGRKLVVIMAHCFKDTPHAIPNLLYQDYEYWIIETLKALAKNSAVNFLVKEHPSHDLYQEQGLLESILSSIGMKQYLIKNDIHTKTIINEADVIVTCGGTIGVEASAFGKTVVIAAMPPYSKKGFTVEPKSAQEYELLLAESVQNITPLNTDQIQTARKTAYTLLELYDNSNTGLELGGIRYIMGEPYDIEAVFRNVIAENRVPLENQNIYKRLLDFHKTQDVSVLNYNKLNALFTAIN